MIKKLVFFLALISVLVFLDLYTKYFVEKNLVTSQKNISQQKDIDYDYILNFNTISNDPENYYIKEIIIIEDRFTFLYTRNYNIGFSVLSFLNNYLTPKQITTLIHFLQIGILLFILAYFFINKMQFFIPFSLIIAGGLGNSIDRIFRGYVVDFVKWSFPELPWVLFNPWPIFNLADVWVSIGGTLLFLGMFFKKQPKKLRDYDPYKKNN